MSATNKYQSRESRSVVRKILLREWDPIGVQAIPGADDHDDEYDAYVGKVYVMLMDERATAQAIAAYLWGVATEYMGLSPSPELTRWCDPTAEIPIDLRRQFETY
jgi:hypothetical protein